jgi:hypothetical protein
MMGLMTPLVESREGLLAQLWYNSLTLMGLTKLANVPQKAKKYNVLQSGTTLSTKNTLIEGKKASSVSIKCSLSICLECEKSGGNGATKILQHSPLCGPGASLLLLVRWGAH